MRRSRFVAASVVMNIRNWLDDGSFEVPELACHFQHSPCELPIFDRALPFIHQRLLRWGETPKCLGRYQLEAEGEEALLSVCSVCGSVLPNAFHSASVLVMPQKVVSGKCHCSTETTSYAEIRLIARHLRTFAYQSTWSAAEPPVT